MKNESWRMQLSVCRLVIYAIKPCLAPQPRRAAAGCLHGMRVCVRGVRGIAACGGLSFMRGWQQFKSCYRCVSLQRAAPRRKRMRTGALMRVRVCAWRPRHSGWFASRCGAAAGMALHIYVITHMLASIGGRHACAKRGTGA